MFWGIWSIFWFSLLLLMFVYPKKWRGIVEKVNDLSAEMGVLSTESAAKVKAFEISLGFKMLVLFSAIGGLFIVFFDIILTTQ